MSLQVLDRDLSDLVDAEDVDTLGGLVSSLAGHVPLRGETLTADGFQFEVLDADPRRVKRIKIRRIVPEQPAAVQSRSASNEADAPQDGLSETAKSR